jgi:hypothetical protein
LITYALIRGGHGEKSIGAVYSANTLGSIVGVSRPRIWGCLSSV